MATIDNEQLELAKKYVAALADVERIQSRIEQSYTNQVKIASQLNNVFSQRSGTADYEESISAVSAALKKVAGDLQNFNEQITNSFSKVNNSSTKAFASIQKQSNAVGDNLNGLDKHLASNITSLNNLEKSRAMRNLSDDALRSITSNAKLIAGIEDTIGMSKILNTIGLKGYARAFKNPVEASKSLHIQSDALAKNFEKKLPKSLIVFGAAISGMVQGFRNVIALSKGILGFMGSLADTAFSVASAIVAIPFKMFYGIVDIADKGSMYFTELLQAIENLRKAFGDIRGPTNTTIKELSHNMTGFKETGLSTWKVFGTLAERLAYIQPIVEAMGGTFQVLRKEFFDNGGALLAYQKALGVTAEQMQEMGSRAISLGDTLADTFKGIGKYALDLGKTFKIDSKILSRDMVKALGDVKHFANVTTKEIGIAAVYAKKLGTELDKITGTLDAFETFDTAAENVAKLSQSFGVQVDAFELMEAQNPADQIDKLRKAFKDAGQDASTFSRQQLKLLSQTTGLDEATARQVFSAKNYGESLDQIKKKAGETEKKTMTQAEAMQQLAANIERLVKVMGPGGHFMERFFKGFLTGVQSTKEAYGAFLDIRQALELTQLAGVRVGRAFVHAFPGVKDFFEGIQKIFDPKKFTLFINEVEKILTSFFKEIGTGKFSFSKLMDELMGAFDKQFGRSGDGVNQVKKGFMTFATALRDIAVQAINWASRKIADTISGLADLIADPTAFFAKARAKKNELQGQAISFFAPLADAMLNAIEKVWPQIKKLFGVVVTKIIDYVKSDEFKSLIKPLYPVFATAFFGPILAKSVASAATTALISAVTGGGEKAAVSSVMKKGLVSVGSKIGLKATTAVTAGIVGAVALAAVGISEGMEKYKGAIEGGFSDAEKTIGAGTAGLIDTLTLGLLPPGWSQTIAQTVAEGANTISSLLNSYLPGVGTAIFDIFGDAFQILGGVGDVLVGIFTGNTDKILDGVGNFFAGLGHAFVDLFIKLPVNLFVAATKISAQIFAGFVSFLGGTLERVCNWLGLDGAAQFFRGVKDFWRNALPDIGGAFQTASKWINSFFDSTENDANKKAASTADAIKKASADVAKAPAQAFEKAKVDFNKDPTGYVTAASNVVEGLKNIKETLGTIKVSEIADSLKQVSAIQLPDVSSAQVKSLDDYGKMFSSFSSFIESVGEASKSIKKAAISSSLNAVHEMIEVANKLQDALGNGSANTIDVKSRLARVATGAGLGSAGNYTIKNKDVIINMNLTVYMDVSEVERVMITQQKSVLRDRLNTLAEKVPTIADQPNFPIKTNTTPGLIKGGEK